MSDRLVSGSWALGVGCCLLHQQIRRTIRRHALCPPGSRVLVGLSGGSDSVALALLLRELSEQDGFSVVSLAHLNHQLRLHGRARRGSSAATWRPASVCRSSVESVDVALVRAVATTLDRGCRAPAAIRLPSPGCRVDVGRSNRRRPHPRRSGGDVSAEADSRRRA